MKIRYFGAFTALLFLDLYATDAKNSIRPDYPLKEEFNVREFWRDGMTWDEFNSIKILLQREGLIKYVDKIEQQKMAKAAGLEVPKTYIASRDKVRLVRMISKLKNYVAKVTHLSWSDGLIIVKNRVNMMSNKRITPEKVQKKLFAALKMRPREGQAWALTQVQPGYMIQEYVPNRMEIKVQTVFGKVIAALYMGGETSKATTKMLAQYDRDGNLLKGTIKAPKWWAQAVEKAELMAKGTDSLRIDFLVKKDGTLLLNELEIYPEINWAASAKIALAKAVNDGYRKQQS